MHAMIFNAGVPSYYYGILTIVIHCWFRMRGSKVNFYVKKTSSLLMKSSLLRRKFVLFVLFTVLNEESSIPLRIFYLCTAHSSIVLPTTSLLISLDDIRNDCLWLKKDGKNYHFLYSKNCILTRYTNVQTCGNPHTYSGFFSVIFSEVVNKERYNKV
jgi:hypothetical protein